MYHYLAYGLEIASVVRLPWLVEGGTGSDVHIVFGETPSNVAVDLGCSPWFQVNETEMLLFAEGVGRCWVHDNTIVLDLCEGASSDLLHADILGSCLGVLLHWRGHLVLHASAVRLPHGNAVAFLGHKTAGKSTMAGLFYFHGHPLVTDDVCPLRLKHDGALVSPGYPNIKLDPAVLEAMGESPADYRRLPLKTRVKHSYSAAQGFHPHPVPADAFYFLEQGDKVTVEPLSATSALPLLYANIYRKGFLVSQRQRQWTLAMCVRLVSSIPVYRLRRPKRLGDAPTVIARLLERHGTK